MNSDELLKVYEIESEILLIRSKISRNKEEGHEEGLEEGLKEGRKEGLKEGLKEGRKVMLE